LYKFHVAHNLLVSPGDDLLVVLVWMANNNRGRLFVAEANKQTPELLLSRSASQPAWWPLPGLLGLGSAPVTLRLEDSEPVTLKKESSRPCVLPCLLLFIFLQPLRILSSLPRQQTHTKLKVNVKSYMSGQGGHSKWRYFVTFILR